MRTQVNAGILGLGMAVPTRVLTNADLERMVDTSDEWITTRTGIKQRYISGPEETSSTLGAEAARKALEDAKVRPEELDLVICATATGDYPWPATACLIQDRIGAARAAAFDLSAACTGFVFALETAAGFIRAGGMRRILVVGVDTLTKQVDWTDRATCVLFGDGAGAAVLGPCAPNEGILATAMGTNGAGADQIWLESGGNRAPVTIQMIEEKRNVIRMKGAEVFKFAVRIMGDISIEALCKAGIRPEEVDLFIPHQANIRIIQSAAEKMSLPPERVFVNVDRYGNTSAASIGIALLEAVQQKRIRRGSVLVTVGFGAGLTWGANVIRWSRNEA